MLRPNFVIVGTGLMILGSWPYLRDTLKGTVKPNKVSWFLWALAPMIAAYAQLRQGVGILFLTTFIVGFVPLVIFLASFFNKQAEWKITKFDLICGLLSILGLVLWQITKVGNVAIFFSIMADGLAAIPTIIKSFYAPESENDILYWFAFVNAAIGLLVIDTWTFEYWSFPAYLVIVDVLIAVLIRFKIGRVLRGID